MSLAARRCHVRVYELEVGRIDPRPAPSTTAPDRPSLISPSCRIRNTADCPVALAQCALAALARRPGPTSTPPCPPVQRPRPNAPIGRVHQWCHGPRGGGGGDLAPLPATRRPLVLYRPSVHRAKPARTLLRWPSHPSDGGAPRVLACKTKKKKKKPKCASRLIARSRGHRHPSTVDPSACDDRSDLPLTRVIPPPLIGQPISSNGALTDDIRQLVEAAPDTTACRTERAVASSSPRLPLGPSRPTELSPRHAPTSSLWSDGATSLHNPNCSKT